MTAEFGSEAALCRAFLSAVPEDWQAYPETGDFDIVLAHRSGCQIGIEAKLALNAKVIEQAMPSISSWSTCRQGPDFRAVMVPGSKTGGMSQVCSYLGLTVIGVYSDQYVAEQRRYTKQQQRFSPDLPVLKTDNFWDAEHWFDWCPAQRIRLPDYIPDVAAGVSAPTQLTHWKIGAIKIAVTLERLGFVSRKHFEQHRISISRWITGGWIVRTERRGVFVKGTMPDFRAQHQKNYAEIEADFEKWNKPVDVAGDEQLVLKISGADQ